MSRPPQLPAAQPSATGGPLWPGRGLFVALLLWLLCAISATAWPMFRPVFLSVGVAIMVITLVLAIRLRRAPVPTILRIMPENFPLGEWTRIKLRIEGPENTDLRLEIFDHYPTQAELRGLPLRLILEAGAVVEPTYHLRPRRRGAFAFGLVEIWLSSRWDLVRRRCFLGESQDARVLPNFRPVLERGLAGIELQLASLGAHLQRRRGDGSEFQNLRDYRQGDSMRIIDWKATARRNRLVSRQYQDERNQQIMLLLDCGRRMHAREGDLTHFDHVLDASLMLAYVAGRQGDAVGFQTFAGESRHLPPVQGPQALSRLLNGLYDLQTSSQSPDYVDAVAQLMKFQRRRSLVLLLTNLRDEDSAEVVTAIRSLARRHLVLVASLRENILKKLSNQPISGFESALETSSARAYLRHRRKAHETARAEGAFVLDVEPQHLPTALVHHYLEIKRAGRL